MHGKPCFPLWPPRPAVTGQAELALCCRVWGLNQDFTHPPPLRAAAGLSQALDWQLFRIEYETESKPPTSFPNTYHLLSSEINKVSSSLQRKGLTVCAGSGKVQVFKQKFKFWKTVHRCELDGLPILTDFSDEVGGDVNKRDLFDPV